jgi:acetyl-CoA acetyltransferase
MVTDGAVALLLMSEARARAEGRTPLGWLVDYAWAGLEPERMGRGAVGEIDPARVNVNGGAIALGHPVGATGARLVLTLLKELARRGARRGLATLCIGGGQGGAILVEAIPPRGPSSPPAP